MRNFSPEWEELYFCKSLEEYVRRKLSGCYKVA
jgi:hypothetical protein